MMAPGRSSSKPTAHCLSRRCSIPPVADATAQVGTEFIEQVIQLTIKVIQGDAKTLSFGLNGEGQVTEVQGEGLQSWSVRQVGSERFLDLHLKEGVSEFKPSVSIRSPELTLPASIELTHLTPGESVGFDSMVNLKYAPGVEGTVIETSGFAPLDAGNRANRFQTTTGGQIKLSLNRSGASPAPVELVDTTLKGDVHPNGKSIRLSASQHRPCHRGQCGNHDSLWQCGCQPSADRCQLSPAAFDRGREFRSTNLFSPKRAHFQ